MHAVGLTDLVQAGGLDSRVAEHGENLSQGQRQLLCIARVMVRSTRICLLDEATSAMDAETDQAVQLAMERHWQTAGGTGRMTSLTIAHRLSTILDHDKILVLSFGKVVEFGAPAELRAKPNGGLAKMLDEAGYTLGAPSVKESEGTSQNECIKQQSPPQLVSL
eukprot:gnl/MRDRNA2_/MRDRNA2_348521_c0_seq1.p1 gnl/MRDRNA2_/MRDRNA2_348521_c0~~gnl/MRDRNA2_/MRDRNA2_348521_c0_seq1.p1  ORF type:complete len:183 (-),score=41.16 gnl/MRDRNA2_/MRDRNA2_348521_c0_seq1:51-542(-)